MQAANDNIKSLTPSLDFAEVGQAVTLRQPHRKFGKCYAEFVRHAGDGKHIFVRKLISSMWKARWTKPIKVLRSDVIETHAILAQVN